MSHILENYKLKNVLLRMTCTLVVLFGGPTSFGLIIEDILLESIIKTYLALCSMMLRLRGCVVVDNKRWTINVNDKIK